MSLPKLGEVIDGKWMVTSRYPHGMVEPVLGFVVLTPIPDGCVPEDLGRKFAPACIMYADLEPNERLSEWTTPAPEPDVLGVRPGKGTA